MGLAYTWDSPPPQRPARLLNYSLRVRESNIFTSLTHFDWNTVNENVCLLGYYVFTDFHIEYFGALFLVIVGMSGLALGGLNYTQETSDARLEVRLQLDCTDELCRPSSSLWKASLTQQLCSIAFTHQFILDVYARW